MMILVNPKLNSDGGAFLHCKVCVGMYECCWITENVDLSVLHIPIHLPYILEVLVLNYLATLYTKATRIGNAIDVLKIPLGIVACLDILCCGIHCNAVSCLL